MARQAQAAELPLRLGREEVAVARAHVAARRGTGAVAPADLPDAYAIELPKNIDIAITADIARRFGIATNNLYRGEAQIGTVTVQGDKVLFNGRPLQPAAEADLIALCARKQP